MNATVAKIVELLFQNVEMTSDVQAVHDEVMRNCQDRFDDLRAQGKSEDDAIGCVIESLKGMEDVIDAYPKKERHAEPEGGESGQDSDCGQLCFEGVERISYDIRDADLVIEPTGGTQVTVTFDDCPLKAHMSGGCLHVEAEHRGGSWSWLTGALFCGHGGDVRIGVPAGHEIGLTARSMSGDISVRDVQLREAEISSTSGDATLRLPMENRLHRAAVNTASGDIVLSLCADALSVRTMSGEARLRGECGRLEASSVSGEVSFEGACRDVALKAVSGDIDLHCFGGAPETVTANSTSGDVRLWLPASAASVSLRASTVSGSVRNDFADVGASSQVRVTAASVSGDVEVRKG